MIRTLMRANPADQDVRRFLLLARLTDKIVKPRPVKMTTTAPAYRATFIVSHKFTPESNK